MLIRSECEHCATPLLVESDWAGKVIRCSECWCETTVRDCEPVAEVTGEREVPVPSVARRKWLLPVIVSIVIPILGAIGLWTQVSTRPAADVAVRALLPPLPHAAVERLGPPVQPTAPRGPESRVAAGLGTRTEKELLADLASAPEISLTRAAHQWLADAAPADETGKHALAVLLAKKHEMLAGLPFEFGPACRSDAKHASDLDRCSRYVRTLLEESPRDLPERFLSERFLSDDNLLKPKWLPAFMQMLPAAPMNWRVALVDRLSKMSTVESSQALAHLAVYDTTKPVRTAAIAALRERATASYVEIMLGGLRHPWAPAAEHAALAIAELKPVDVKSRLKQILELPDPATPVRQLVHGEHRLVIPTLVRMNHLKNCLACHQRSAKREGQIIAAAPHWDRPLSSYNDSDGAALVRADVVYLRQNFSSMLSVSAEVARVWPTEQRFDFFVGAREPTPAERDAHARGVVNRDYPQKEAVRFAFEAVSKQ